MKKSLPLLILLIVFFQSILNFDLLGQDSIPDSTKPKRCKTGWKPDGLPILAYNSDIGLQYGAAAELYYYGDNCYSYPKYLHSFYLEASFTTKGGNIFQLFYDSDKLIKNIRLTADLSYLTEKALDFYGFNGYKAVYNQQWEDDQDPEYISRMFYRHERKLFKFSLGFQGKFIVPQLRWFAGFTILNIAIDSVNTDKINKGLDAEKKVPNVPGLYENYVNWGVISEKERNGGINNMVKVGLIYDTRDNEANPMRGIWSEVNVNFAPSFLGDGNFGFTKLALIHRQYFTLIKKKLSFAYRLAYQGTIGGETPFYNQPLMINSWEKTTTIDGLGGSRNIRGILRNRVVGDGTIYGTAEFRYRFLKFSLFHQDLYIGANAFVDAGMVVQEINIDRTMIPKEVDQKSYFSDSKEYPHLAYGGGLKLTYNENFVISADVGVAADKRDGNMGVYIGFGFLF